MFRNFPQFIKVGNVHIRVEICEDVSDDTAWGNYSASLFRIRFQDNIPSTGKAIEVVLHEVLHAIFHCADLKDTDDEERTVATFSTWMAMVLMDNPLLVKWLTCATKM